MRRINPLKAALSVGGVLGVYHLAWATLVLAGLAKPIMDFILQLHFIQLNYAMAPFSFARAAGLIAFTFTVGALFGLVFAAIWNGLSEQAPEWTSGDQASQPAR